MAGSAVNPRRRVSVAVVLYAIAHPGHGVAMVRAGWKLRRRGWWHKWPFLPLADPAYWRFRTVTAYGDEGGPTPRDVALAAKWSVRHDAER